MQDELAPNGLIYITTQTIPRTALSDLDGHRLVAMGSFASQEWELYVEEGAGQRLIASSYNLAFERDMGLLVDINGYIIHNSLNQMATSKKLNWRVVPSDPTEKMLHAGSKAEVGQLQHIDGEILRTQGKMRLKTSSVVLGGEQLRRVWRLMLNAAGK